MSALEGARTLFLDLQEGLVEAGRTQTAAEVRRGAKALMAMVQAVGIPVRASTIPGGPTGPPPLIAELTGVAGTARRGFSAFQDPEVTEWAKAAGPGGLILAGMATEGAVLATALDARARGLRVHVVIDACAGLSHRTEDAALRQMERGGVTTTSIPGLAGTLDLDFATQEGAAVLKAMEELTAG